MSVGRQRCSCVVNMATGSNRRFSDSAAWFASIWGYLWVCGTPQPCLDHHQKGNQSDIGTKHHMVSAACSHLAVWPCLLMNRISILINHPYLMVKGWWFSNNRIYHDISTWYSTYPWYGHMMLHYCPICLPLIDCRTSSWIYRQYDDCTHSAARLYPYLSISINRVLPAILKW